MLDNFSFPVSLLPVFANINGNVVALPMRKAVVRGDTCEAISVVGSDYSIVSHAQVIEMGQSALEALDLPYDMSAKVTKNGARLFCHFHLPTTEIDVGDADVGDFVSMELILRNSLDCSSAIYFELGARRLICKNGMRVSEKLLRLKRFHTKNIKIDDLSQEVLRLVKMFHEVVIPGWNQLRKIQITRADGVLFIEKVIQEKKFPKRYGENLLSQWEGMDKPNAWMLLNAFTSVITHKIEVKSYDRARILSLEVDELFKSSFLA